MTVLLCFDVYFCQINLYWGQNLVKLNLEHLAAEYKVWFLVIINFCKAWHKHILHNWVKSLRWAIKYPGQVDRPAAGLFDARCKQATCVVCLNEEKWLFYLFQSKENKKQHKKVCAI